MTHGEAICVAATLQASYPRPVLPQATVEAYATMLEDLDVTAVTKAVARLVAACKCLPTIAEIREAVAEEDYDCPTPAEAWSEVSAAFSAVGRNRSPQWSHPLIGKVVDGVGGWTALCNSENVVADRSQFMRAYTEERKRGVVEANVAPLLEHLESKRSGQLGPQKVAGLLKHVGR